MKVFEILLDIDPIGVISSEVCLLLPIPHKINKNKVLPHCPEKKSKRKSKTLVSKQESPYNIP